MEIFVEDIPEEGLTIRADTGKDHWLADLVKEMAGKDYSPKDKAQLTITLLNFEGNVDIRGDVQISTHPTCDRCLRVFTWKRDLPIHIVMAPLYKSERERERSANKDQELIKEDFEFGYYEGDWLDLFEILREQILLNETIQKLCSEDCAGICQKCGQNLNEGPCRCKEERRSAHWEGLKKYRPKSRA